MTISGTETLAATAQSAPAASQKVTAIVGFDGSEPSRRALASASRLVAGRAGSIEVVYVAHPTTGETMYGPVAAELEETFADISEELRLEADRLLGHEQTWTFHRSDGDIARGLMAEAEAQANADQQSQVVIVVGAPAHRYHQVMGSVPAALVHHARVPVLMVP
jgi:nucleotide-binding universal stress UspA family protein